MGNSYMKKSTRSHISIHCSPGRISSKNRVQLRIFIRLTLAVQCSPPVKNMNNLPGGFENNILFTPLSSPPFILGG